MVSHPWKRGLALANVLGLILGALGMYIIGLQLTNKVIQFIGIVTLVLFSLLFSILFYLLIRDYTTLYPTFTRKILGIRY